MQYNIISNTTLILSNNIVMYLPAVLYWSYRISHLELKDQGAYCV